MTNKKRSKITYPIRHPIKFGKRALFTGLLATLGYSALGGYVDHRAEGGNFLGHASQRAIGVLNGAVDAYNWGRGNVNQFSDAYESSDLESESEDFIKKLRDQGRGELADSLESTINGIENKGEIERILEAIKKVATE